MTPALPSGAPRWPVLLPLVLVVLLAHLWLMTGELPVWSAGRPADNSTGGDPTQLPAPPSAGATTPTEPARAVMPVQVSQVRWLSAPAAAVTPPPAARPAPRPAPAPKPQAAEPADTPPPAPAATPAIAVPEPPPAEPTPTEVAAQTAVTPTTPATATAEHTPQATATAPSGATAPADPIASMTLNYEIHGKAKGLNYKADAVLNWANQGQRYSASMEISAFLLGSRTQTSEGRVDAGGLQPERFSDKRRSTEKATHFDPAGRRIRFSSNAPDAPLLAGAQDRLSLFMQLGAMLKARPQAFPPGSSIELQVAGTGSAEVWRFEVGAVESLALPAGSISGLRLVRPPRHEHDSTVEIWFSTAHWYLPARIRITEADGSVADQVLRELPPTVLQ